jgi:hypothetical protein
MDQIDLETELFNKELICSLMEVQADFIAKSVQLTLCPKNCTDMTGAINFAKRLMPDVRAIATVSGWDKETVYILQDGKWRSAFYKCFT